MKWHKSPDELVQAFDHCLPIVAGVQRKAMFGYPCAFVNGHLFCGLHQDGVIVRLSETRRNALVAKGASVFEPMPGRAMKEYVVVPAAIVADREKLRALLSDALAHASSLTPRPRKASAAKSPTKATTPKRRAASAKKLAPAPARKAKPARKTALASARKAKPARKTSSLRHSRA
jgi:TfoX/Sxy family transcriptional regulator of competence genes